MGWRLLNTSVRRARNERVAPRFQHTVSARSRVRGFNPLEPVFLADGEPPLMARSAGLPVTHTRNTPASRAGAFVARSAPPSDIARTDSGDSERREFDDRSMRARTEAMDVLALGSGRYAVHSESGNSSLVEVREGTCTCPDHTMRGARCEHLRRVAIEITAGAVAPPSYVASTCASCSGFALVRPAASEPHLCETHRLAAGDRAWDPVTEAVVLVVGVSAERADAVAIPGTDETVAGDETNADYPPGDPVVAAVYPSVRVSDDGPRPDSLRVYSFPLSRLERLDDDERSSEREGGDGRGGARRC
jgi:hypothetical protein